MSSISWLIVPPGEKTNEQFRKEMKEGVSAYSRRKPIDPAVWSDFERGISYVAGTFEDPKTYAKLRTHLEELDTEPFATPRRKL